MLTALDLFLEPAASRIQQQLHPVSAGGPALCVLHVTARQTTGVSQQPAVPTGRGFKARLQGPARGKQDDETESVSERGVERSPLCPLVVDIPDICLVTLEETPFEPVWSDSIAVCGAARRSLSHPAVSLESQWGKRQCYCWLLACPAHARRRAQDSVGAGRRSVLSAEAVFMKDSEGVLGQARRASHAAVGPAIQVICLVSDCFLLYLLS